MGTKQLLLMRHAKSAWDTEAATDFQRPLASRGRRDLRRMGYWLRAQRLRPQRLLSSAALRAWETAVGVSSCLGLTETQIDFDSRLYMAERQDLLTVIGEADDSLTCVMIVAHNPGLDELVEHLVSASLPRTGTGKCMTTAALAVIDLDRSWTLLQRGSGRLRHLWRPKELP